MQLCDRLLPELPSALRSIVKFLTVIKLMTILMLAINIHVDAKPFLPPATITAKITTDKGVGLAGATVTEKGTKNSLVTKENGAFAINTSQAKQVLVISYVGYETQELAASNSLT